MNSEMASDVKDSQAFQIGMNVQHVRSMQTKQKEPN